MLTLEERVRRGIEFLDKYCQGWADKLDLDSLNMASSTTCICGQLQHKHEFLIHERFNSQFGFYSKNESNPEYHQLNKIWKEKISTLRTLGSK